MKPLKAHFAVLTLTSSLVGAGSAIAQSAPVARTPNAADQCAKIQAADSRKACLDLGELVNALKSGNNDEVNNLQNKMQIEKSETRKTEKAEALNLFRNSPSSP